LAVLESPIAVELVPFELFAYPTAVELAPVAELRPPNVDELVPLEELAYPTAVELVPLAVF